MALGDKAREQAIGAKGRVLSGQSKARTVQPRPFVSYRPDDPEQGSKINPQVRSMAPELFNPQAQLQATQNYVANPARKTLPNFQEQLSNTLNTIDAGKTERQQRAQDSILTDIAQSGGNLIRKYGGPIADLLPEPNKNSIVGSIPERGSLITQIGDASRRTQIPYITDNSTVPNFLRGAGDTATFGLSTYADRMAGLGDRADAATRTTAGKAGQIAGAIALPAGRVRAGAGVLRNLWEASYAGGLISGLGEVGEELTNRNDQTYGQRLADVGIGTALGGLGGAIGHGIGATFNKLLKRNNVPEETIQEILALPAPGDTLRKATGKAVETPDVITPEYTFALPAPRVEAPTTARIAQQQNPYREQFENLMRRAQQLQQEGRFTPGREDLEVENLWSQMAGREGVSLDELIHRAYVTKPDRITPDLVQRARDNQYSREVAGAPFPVRSRSDRMQPQGVLGDVAAPQTVPARAPRGEVLPANSTPSRPRTEVGEVKPVNEQTPPIVQRANEKIDTTVDQAPLSRPYADDATKVTGSIRSSFEMAGKKDEVRFTERLREQDLVPDELAEMLERRQVTAPRTSLEKNEQLAHNLIKKVGVDKLYSDLTKRVTKITNPVEGTALRLLAEYYGRIGDYDRVYDLVAKTGVSGREAGQFIQSLSQWKRVSAEGIITAAERQLNRRSRGGIDTKVLSPQQRAEYGKLGDDLRKLQDIEEEAQDIALMLAKKGDRKLTEVETERLKNFQTAVKDARGSIKNLEQRVHQEDRKTIRTVSNVAPRNRTRDQVLDYLSAVANEARRELARRRNVGFAAKVENEPTLVLYAKIGAEYIAQGVVRFSDWSEQMVKRGVTENLPSLFVKSGDRFRKANGMPSLREMNQLVSQAVRNRGIDEQTANSLRVAVTEIGFAANDAKAELTRDLQRSLRTLGEVTLGEQIKAYLTNAMLLNFQTYGRNLGGVVQQLTLDKVSKAFAVPVDWAISKMTGERTVKFFTNNQANMWKSYAEGSAEGWSGVSKSGQLGAEDIRPLAFRSKYNPLTYMSKLTSATLESLDRVAYDQASGEVFATYGHFLGKAKGLTNKQIKEQMPQLINQLDDRIGQIADEAGLRATYQDKTILSMMATGIQKGLNYPTDALFKGLRNAGLPSKLSLEGFGLGDIVLFFAKTPANLIMRGIEYSPLGYMRSLGYLVEGLPKGNVFPQRKFALSLARATTGTLGLSMVGWDLYNKGILTGPASKDADERSLQEATGSGAYRVNVNAIKRYVMSGLDPEAAKPVDGDRWFEYSWLQPAAISLGMGVSAAMAVQQAEKKSQEEGVKTPLVKMAGQAILGGLRTILENPMVQGATNVASAVSDLAEGKGTDKTTQLFTGVPAMFVPSAVGQLRRTLDNQMRETRDRDSAWNTVVNQVMNKIPKLSERLPQSYNTLGHPREYVIGGEAGSVNQILQQFLTPARNSSFKPSADAQIVLDLLQQTGDKNVLPRMSQRYIRVTNPTTGKPQNINLSPEKYSDLQRRVGSMTMDILREVGPDILADKSLKPDEISSFLQKLLTKVGTQVRNEVKVEMGYQPSR